MLDVSSEALLGSDVRRFRPFAAFRGIERDRFAFAEGLKAVAFDVGEVDEQVIPSVVVRDEAVALRFIEPFDGSGSHFAFLSSSAQFHREVETPTAGHTWLEICSLDGPRESDSPTR
jgi:hypothetical protein